MHLQRKDVSEALHRHLSTAVAAAKMNCFFVPDISIDFHFMEYPI